MATALRTRATPSDLADSRAAFPVHSATHSTALVSPILPPTPQTDEAQYDIERAGGRDRHKSTLGRAILQLVRPTAGEVRFDGTELTKLSENELRPLRRRMQMVFQDPLGSLNPRMTVGEAVAEPMLVHRLATAAKSRDKAAELFSIVGLNPDMLNCFPHEFSGGHVIGGCCRCCLLLVRQLSNAL
jgi:ABC-type antimicrobial peptide transport system ATPase subunit